MIKVAMTGGDGLVGSRITELLKEDFTFINFGQSQMDITDRNEVIKKLKDVDFDIFLHLAAYTNVQGAEENEKLTYAVNRDGTKNIYEAVSSKKRNLIYISTDFVFDGNSPPYYEDSKPNPLAVYAKSKYEGEKILEDNAMIVRIAYPYRADFPNKKDFFRTFKSYLEAGKTLTMIHDSQMTPTFIDDIAYGLRHLMHNFSPEIFHLVGSSSVSPYEAVLEIANKFKLDGKLVKKISYEEYLKGKAALPRYAEIKSKKNDFWKMKSLSEGLDEIAKQLLKI